MTRKSYLCWSVKVQYANELFVCDLSSVGVVNYVKHVVQLRLGRRELCNNDSSNYYYYNYYNNYYNYYYNHYYKQELPRQRDLSTVGVVNYVKHVLGLGRRKLCDNDS